jgi:hypothetical protein
VIGHDIGVSPAWVQAPQMCAGSAGWSLARTVRPLGSSGSWRVATRSTLSPAPGWQDHERAQPGPASAGAPARRPLNHTAHGGPRAPAGWWRVTHRRRADPTTHAKNRLTRRPAWTCWVIPQDPVCPAHHRAGYGGTPPACRSRTCSRRRLGSQLPTGDCPYPFKTRARGLGPVARVASAYVTAVPTTAASRCRRIAWHEVAGSTPRL